MAKNNSSTLYQDWHGKPSKCRFISDAYKISEPLALVTKEFKKSNRTPSFATINGTLIIYEIVCLPCPLNSPETMTPGILMTSKMIHLVKIFPLPKPLPAIICPLWALHIQRITNFCLVEIKINQDLLQRYQEE